MYTAIKGIYENGNVTFLERVPIKDKYEVLITFLEKKDNTTEVTPARRKAGSMIRLGEKINKHFSIPTDFNEPLDDLKDYV